MCSMYVSEIVLYTEGGTVVWEVKGREVSGRVT